MAHKSLGYSHINVLFSCLFIFNQMQITYYQEGLGEVLTTTEIADPFFKLFWGQQQRAVKVDPRGMR